MQTLGRLRHRALRRRACHWPRRSPTATGGSTIIRPMLPAMKRAAWECVSSPGRSAPSRPHTKKSRGLPRSVGAPECSLMSFDKDAFSLLRLAEERQQPRLPERAAAYVLALNDLLKPGNPSRINRCGVGFLFWTKKPVEKTPISILEEADPEQVRQLLLLDEGSLHLRPERVLPPGRFWERWTAAGPLLDSRESRKRPEERGGLVQRSAHLQSLHWRDRGPAQAVAVARVHRPRRTAARTAPFN